MTDPVIDLAVADGIATITLLRPTYAPEVGAALLDAFDAVDGDDAVRVLVLTGSGQVFCAGADLGGGGDRFAYPADRVHVDPGGVLSLRMHALLKPVIVAVNGAAAGIGVTLPLAADIRLASDDARFAFAFTRIGIVPEAASAWFLPQVVGLPRALEWTLTARRVGAEEALAAGLVTSLHAPAALLPAAYGLAREIADGTAPVATAVTRQLLRRLSGEAGPEAAHRVDSAAMQALGGSADARAGIEAFLAKQVPVFPGRVSTDLPPLPWRSAAEEIALLVARRCRALDEQDWSTYAACHTSDFVSEALATETGGTEPVRGIDAVVEQLRTTLAGCRSLHRVDTPEIALTGPDSATGVWAMEDRLWWDGAEEEPVRWLHGFGRYHETYRRQDGRWLIAGRRLERVRVSRG
jgi:enoyl-CoA hydratase/carnithine racemase